jgi:hypothetical protein
VVYPVSNVKQELHHCDAVILITTFNPALRQTKSAFRVSTISIYFISSNFILSILKSCHAHGHQVQQTISGHHAKLLPSYEIILNPIWMLKIKIKQLSEVAVTNKTNWNSEVNMQVFYLIIQAKLIQKIYRLRLTYISGLSTGRGHIVKTVEALIALSSCLVSKVNFL